MLVNIGKYKQIPTTRFWSPLKQLELDLQYQKTRLEEYSTHLNYEIRFHNFYVDAVEELKQIVLELEKIHNMMIYF